MAKIHVVDVLGKHDINTAKAFDGVRTIFEFKDGKWRVWEREADKSLMDSLALNSEFSDIPRPRHRQAVGMFIRMEV